MTITRIGWTGVDDPARRDDAVLDLAPDGMRAHGSSTTPGYALAWSLDASGGWITRELRVAVTADRWSRTLVLRRDPAGTWGADASAAGSADLDAPGLADADSLAGALDADLGLCPATNTMPIRRLGLLERDRPPVTLLMAWVEVPSLRVIAAPQHYSSRTGDDGRRRVVYESEERDFRSELDVDADGVVIEYPGLAVRAP